MCLNHVYIVLEPIGSARLMFRDDRYYEFICFDLPKIFWSPGCDHRHDEESRNGRDIKIDILDGYIRTPEVFRVISEKTGVPEGTGTPPGEVMGHMGLSGEREGHPKVGRAPPPPLVRIGLGEGGGAPLSFSLPTSFPLLVGVLLLLGGGLLLGAPTRAGRPPPSLLYIRGQGGTSRHTS